MTPLNYLQSAVRHIRCINCEEDRQVLDILYVRVCRAIDMRRESSRAGEFVIDWTLLYQSRSCRWWSRARLTLLLKKQHLLPRQLPQNPQQPLTPQQPIKQHMIIRIILSATQDSLAFGIDFFVGHPWRFRGSGQVVDFLGPGLEGGGLGRGEDVSEDEVAVWVEELVLGGGYCVFHLALLVVQLLKVWRYKTEWVFEMAWYVPSKRKVFRPFTWKNTCMPHLLHRIFIPFTLSIQSCCNFQVR